MVKGLSKLQKDILIMAYTKGWTAGDTRERPGGYSITTDEALLYLFTSKTNSSRASVSRAFRRLEERGLAYRCQQYQVSGHLLWSGVKLNNKGVEKAKRLQG